MLKRFFKKKPSDLNPPMYDVLNKMKQYGPDNEEFPRLLDYLERLTKMKQEESRFGVSPDTMAIVAGNLLGIVIVVSHERIHVLVSKGLGLILKPHH